MTLRDRLNRVACAVIMGRTGSSPGRHTHGRLQGTVRAREITMYVDSDVLAARVQAGAAWLDSVAPGWRTVLQPGTYGTNVSRFGFDMFNSDRCVLAQVADRFGWNDGYGAVFADSYLAGLDKAGQGWGSLDFDDDDVADAYRDRREWSIDHGFSLYEYSSEDYATLSDLWMAQLTPVAVEAA